MNAMWKHSICPPTSDPSPKWVAGFQSLFALMDAGTRAQQNMVATISKSEQNKTEQFEGMTLHTFNVLNKLGLQTVHVDTGFSAVLICLWSTASNRPIRIPGFIWVDLYSLSEIQRFISVSSCETVNR